MPSTCNVSSLFKSVPVLTSLEVSPFLFVTSSQRSPNLLPVGYRVLKSSVLGGLYREHWLTKETM